jgi:N-acetylneuraminic acid mutarotase
MGAVATLSDGKVLIAGGLQFTSGNPPLDTAELFDPATGKFSETSNMTSGRSVYAAALLPNGKVILTGGDGASSTLASAEVFNDSQSSFSAASSMMTARAYHVATQLSDGRILLTGGEIDSGAVTFLSSAELFDPSSGQFTATAGMNNARSGHTATSLNTGAVLVTGGQNQSGTLSSAEIFSLN